MQHVTRRFHRTFWLSSLHTGGLMRAMRASLSSCTFAHDDRLPVRRGVVMFNYRAHHGHSALPGSPFARLI